MTNIELTLVAFKSILAIKFSFITVILETIRSNSFKVLVNSSLNNFIKLLSKLFKNFVKSSKVLYLIFFLFFFMETTSLETNSSDKLGSLEDSVNLVVLSINNAFNIYVITCKFFFNFITKKLFKAYHILSITFNQ